MTNEQRDALARKYEQSADGCATLAEFIERAQPTFGMDGAIVAPWCGMWLCVETDGYCHT